MRVEVEGHSGSLVGGVEAFVRGERGEETIADRWVMDGNHLVGGVIVTEAVYEGEKHIPAPKAVGLYDGEGDGRHLDLQRCSGGGGLSALMG